MAQATKTGQRRKLPVAQALSGLRGAEGRSNTFSCIQGLLPTRSGQRPAL